MKQITDKDGNRIITLNRNKQVSVVQLRIINQKARVIGTISHPEKTLIVKRDVEKHIYQKLNAYSINAELVRNHKYFGFDKILLHLSNGREFKLPAEKAIEIGSYLNFKREGYELQLFLNMIDLAEFEKGAAK